MKSILWIFVIIAAFIIGFITSNVTKGKASSVSSILHTPAKTAALTKADGKADSAGLCQQLNAIFVDSRDSNFVKLTVSIDLIDDLDLLQMQDILNCLEALPNDYAYSSLLRPLFNRFASIAPAKAMEKLDKMHVPVRLHGGELQYIILTHWAKTSPESAFKWIESRGYPEGGSFYYNANLAIIFSGIAKRNYEEAIELVDTFANKYFLRNAALTGIGYQTKSNTNFIKLVAMSKNIDSPDIAVGLFQSWFKHNQQAVFDYLEKVTDHEKRRQLNYAIFEELLNIDHIQAANWFLAAQPNDEATLDYIIEQLSFRDMSAAITFIQQLPNINAQSKLKNILGFHTMSDPQLVIKYLKLIESEEVRLALSKDIYFHLGRTSSKLAEDFSKESPFGSKVKSRF